MPHRLAGPLPRLSLAALLLLPCLALAAQGDPSSDPDPQSALERGNRHFRAGRLEEALSSYRAGWDPRHPHPILAYNLGTTAHHLGRLPEAVLWYRRAIRIAGDGDVWLTENLARARERLAAPRWPPSGLLAWLARQRSGLWILGAIAGWTALGLLLSRRTALRRTALRWTADVLVLLAAGLLVAGWLVPHLAPVPAVVLQPCGAGRVPAGAEVWGRPAPEGAFTVATPEGPVDCPPGTVASIAP